MPDAFRWADWLEQTSLAASIRQDLWLYPVLEIVHILGIVLLVGPAFMFDLRLLGWSKEIPVGRLADHLLPWSRWSLLLIFPSGLLLFITNASSLAQDVTFWLKLGLILLAGLNTLLFHRLVFTSVYRWNRAMPAPLPARVIAVSSIVLWTAIICCGRLLAY